MKNCKLYYLFFLAAVGVSGPVYAQITLTGTVKNKQNEAVIGASVFIRNSSIGTQTDLNGTFKLEVAEKFNDSTLIISSIGYATQQLLIQERRQFDIVLAEDSKTLEEVVVTGYQSEERGKILGAVNTVSPELINKVPVSGVDQAIQGRVPGVVVTQNTGMPGAGVIVRIRGVGSINSYNGPLYVIDGLPTLDATAIAPQDIATLTVLKDASAAAIYGSRASNGVVLITTKMGASNKQTITYSSQVGEQNPVRLVPMASTAQYVSIYNQAANADNPDEPSFLQRPLITPQFAATLPNVNQVKAIMRPNAVLQTHSLSISGGEGKTRYLIAGSYYDQQGIIYANDYSRFTGRVNIESDVKKWLRAGVNMNVSGSTQDIIGDSGDGAGGNGGGEVRYAYFRSPAIPIKDASGNFVDLPQYYNFFGDGYNPVGMLAYNQNKKLTDRIFGRLFLILKPLEGLTITSSLGVDFTSSNQRRFDTNWGTNLRINNPNVLTVTDARLHTLTYSNFANYVRSFGNHTLTFLLGTEAITNASYTIVGSDSEFSNQSPTLTYLGNGLTPTKTVTESSIANTLLSYFGKVAYRYSDKYLATATLRRDGSSRFGPNNRWGTFYAGSVGWRIDKETFLMSSSWIDKLLLRAGYGVIGNQEIGDYAFSDQIGTTYNYPFGGVKSVGYATSVLGNANVKWESSNQLNVGADLVSFNGKFSASVDYFRKITSNLLVAAPIALSSGLASPPVVNNGTILNRGVEVLLNYSDKVGDFNFSVTPNFAFLHNEVLAVNSPVEGGLYGAQYTTRTEKGYPVGSFYMLTMQGIFQTQQAIDLASVQGPKTGATRIQPGDVQYKDINGDGVIDNNDVSHVGSAIPTMSGGLNIMVGYKNWDLSVFFQGAWGQKILSVLNRDIEGFYRPFNVTERYYTDHWTGPGTTNVYPRASWNAASNNTQISTRFLENGGYTRLKNLQIGYSVPNGFLKRYGFTHCRVYFSGTNLFTWTKYSGMDPEMSVSNNSVGDGDKANGIDWGTYPAAKSYNLGVNLTF
jgi:TonB-linked SusC/RagA family outer membrane protein